MSVSTAVPSVSVITATRGRPENLAQLVPIVLAEQSVWHYVVVVDGEDPETVALLTSLKDRFDRLVFAQVPRSGQLRALELGITMTDAEVVLLLDDDVVPMPGLAGAHARAHANQTGLVLVGTMPVQLPARRADIGTLLYASDYVSHCARMEEGLYGPLDHLWLGNVSMRRSDCLRIGLYSADFTASYHADQDLGFRLTEAGLVGRYDPSLAAVHRHRRTGRESLHDARRRGAGLAQLHEVHRALGPFDPSVFTEDLPPTLAAVVRRVGSSRLALGVAGALLAAAGALRLVGWASGRVRLAKLARRIMFVRGATAGEGEKPERASDRSRRSGHARLPGTPLEPRGAPGRHRGDAGALRGRLRRSATRRRGLIRHRRRTRPGPASGSVTAGRPGRPAFAPPGRAWTGPAGDCPSGPAARPPAGSGSPRRGRHR
jgi:GT2 family glycosyltransferase